MVFFFFFVFLGGDLREERPALRGPGAAADRAELPRHCHPPRDDPGREAVQVPAVQGFPEGEFEKGVWSHD